ncbi:MAG TPA: DUF4625 domain-containing protein [Chitinophagaceae bacterium]
MRRSFLPYLLFLLTACSKGSEKEKDYEAPVVTLNTPANNQVFTGGQSIMISGTVTDNKYIEQIHIEISNLATAAAYQDIHIHPGAASFNFNQAYTIQAGIAYKIKVIADDASTNSAAKSAEITCN